MSKIKVRAIARGYYGALRNEDDVFHVDEKHKNATWYVPVDKVIAPEVVATEVALPTSLAEAKKLTNAQLQALLEEHGVPFASGDTKVELAEALLRATGADASDGEDLV